tara:strand:+ start:248 stop:2035 length:1788 start_codon:yes stop_codon:yes gene_type:complete
MPHNKIQQSRIPSTSFGINVNRCPNPRCDNFDIEALNSKDDDNYKISSIGKNASALKCLKCGRHFTVKSNKAVHEELERFNSYQQMSTIYRQDGKCCHLVKCSNFGKFVSKHPNNYRKRGKTSKGNQRYQCLSCLITFTFGSNKRMSHPDTKSHENTALFRLLVNQTSINRAMELTDLTPTAIYKKIDMFYERCISFLKEREQQLKEMPIRFLRLSTDRQDYIVNWTHRKDKRNIVLSSIGTTDKKSRYVFGMEVNFDPSIDINNIVNEPFYEEQEKLKIFNRDHARIWTPRDFNKAIEDKNKHIQSTSSLVDEYLKLSSYSLTDAGKSYIRSSLEAETGQDAYDISKNASLPTNGVQIHSEYTMFAHFIYLESLIGHAQKIRFYLDQDNGINRACNLAFSQQVLSGKLHSCFIKIDKASTVDERRTKVAITDKAIKQVISDGEAINEHEAKRYLVRQSIKNYYSFKGKQDKWHFVPIHKIFEVDKYIAIITDSTKMSEDDILSFLLDSSLHPIDNFFQMVRRRISALERPIHSQSNVGRTWTGKAPYNPAMIHKLLVMLKTYYNYCLVDKKDGITPAQRLGLAKGPVEIRKILY